MEQRLLTKMLWQEQHAFDSYPEGVVARVPFQMAGLAFFPGGYGLWMEEDGTGPADLPVGGTMVLGHDFHTTVGYEKSVKAGGERRTQPTWRYLVPLLEEAGVPLSRCFFTNVYMGLRAGKRSTGPFPGAKDPALHQFCKEFLQRQLEMQRPTQIITLGLHVPPFLARLSEDLEKWRSVKTIRDLDASKPVRHGVRFGSVSGVSVVALVHPSHRPRTVRYRQYLEWAGHDAELRMLADLITPNGER